jgi:hypothetical protein
MILFSWVTWVVQSSSSKDPRRVNQDVEYLTMTNSLQCASLARLLRPVGSLDMGVET